MVGSVHKTHVRRPRSTNPHQHKQAMDEQRVSRLARQGTARTGSLGKEQPEPAHSARNSQNREPEWNGRARARVCVHVCVCVCVRVHRCITDAPVLSASDVVPRWNVWFRHWSWGKPCPWTVARLRVRSVSKPPHNPNRENSLLLADAPMLWVPPRLYVYIGPQFIPGSCRRPSKLPPTLPHPAAPRPGPTPPVVKENFKHCHQISTPNLASKLK
jgi:hypothetical protein